VTSTQPRRPNVVFVITDDQGYGDLGCTGNPIVQTPHIDAFYRESVKMTQFHVGPTCAPTRSTLMTGHYANSTGVWHTIGGRSLMRSDEWTLAEALRGAGYRTGLFGKWHLGDSGPYRPENRGFETTVVHGGGGISQTPDYWGNDYFDDTYRVNGEPKRFEGYCTDVFFEQAMRFIATHRGEPFFCMIATNAPHSPFNVETHYYERYKGRVPDNRARFYGMITNIDENFGRLRRALEDWGLAEDTIVVFMTDNGTACGADLDRSQFVVDGYNAGMRGKKGSPYDGGHRVPFFVRWPAGALAHGSNVDSLTASVDFMPTILDLCGVPVPEGRTFHGQSIAPLLRGETAGWPDRTIVTDSQRVARPIKWRQSAVMTDRWRLVNGKELYDILQDPEQRTDIAEREPETVARLREAYEAWWEIVSRQMDQEIPIPIGREEGEETLLNAHDWRNGACECPWNQAAIRAGEASNGYWEVDVAEAGEYEFELRRWPKEAERPLAAGIDGDDVSWNEACVAPTSRSWYRGGKAIPVHEASLRVGGREHRTEVAPGAISAQFRVNLQPGPDHVETLFADAEGRELCGAYYVYVRKV